MWIRPHGWTAQLGASRPPARLRCPLTRLQVWTEAAAALPVVVASQSVECEHVIPMLARQYREARWIGGVVVGAS